MKWQKRAGCTTKDEESDDKAEAVKNKGLSGPPVRPPPSKHLYLSKQTDVTDEQSSAANNGNRTK